MSKFTDEEIDAVFAEARDVCMDTSLEGTESVQLIRWLLEARTERDVYRQHNEAYYKLEAEYRKLQAERDTWKEEALKAQKRHDECYYCNCMNRESEKY